MLIRQETAADTDTVYDVVKKAFENAVHTNHDEQNLVRRLRKSDTFIPELSLVAEENGKIVGHILFTKLKVGETVQLSLAPLSVLPEYRNRGIGGQLIHAGHSRAKAMGYDYVILIGHADYYPRFGYFPAARIGVTVPFDVPEENLMAFSLQGKNMPLNGVPEYAKAFFEEGDI